MIELLNEGLNQSVVLKIYEYPQCCVEGSCDQQRHGFQMLHDELSAGFKEAKNRIFASTYFHSLLIISNDAA